VKRLAPTILAGVLLGGAALATGLAGGGLRGNTPFTSSGSITPSGSPNVVQATTAAMTLYVDPTGADSNDCLSTGTGACLTMPGVLAKVPKLLRNLVTINVAAGTYGGFLLSGFWTDVTAAPSTAGIFINGALATVTPTSGSATGTATSGTAGSGTTYGTLTKTAAGWTVNDFARRYLVITGGTGSGQTRLI
jgi:hypothetical protein